MDSDIWICCLFLPSYTQSSLKSNSMTIQREI